MRVECALLCDAASVREGLLHVLGGGISRISVDEFPVRLPLTFALRAVLEPRELQRHHKLHLELVDHAANLQGALDLTFEVEDPDRPTEEAALVVPVSLEPLPLRGPGTYLINATLDSRALGTFPLRVARRESVKASGGNA